jgi:hypothetical protein
MALLLELLGFISDNQEIIYNLTVVRELTNSLIYVKLNFLAFFGKLSFADLLFHVNDTFVRRTVSESTGQC